MNHSHHQNRWESLKQNLPMVVTVLCFVGFMDAETAESASLFGVLIVVAIAWLIKRQRSAVKQIGEPIFQLGRMYAEPPARMRPWHSLAAFAFVLLGVAVFFSTEKANLPARLGMSLLTLAIAGTWLSMISKRLRKLGMAIFGFGFLFAGVMMVWEAIVLVNSGNENGRLAAVRWSAFGGCLLLIGVGVVWSLFKNRSRTAIYQHGVLGPRGLVSWAEAERMELVGSDEKSFLAVGASNGWTLWIEVPEEQRDAVTELLNASTNSTSASSE